MFLPVSAMLKMKTFSLLCLIDTYLTYWLYCQRCDPWRIVTLTQVITMHHKGDNYIVMDVLIWRYGGIYNRNLKAQHFTKTYLHLWLKYKWFRPILHIMYLDRFELMHETSFRTISYKLWFNGTKLCA